MSGSDFTFETTQQNFQQLVVEGSFQRLIVVDFWASWCAPCKLLMPLLVQLAEQYQGKFILAKVNTDQEQALAQQFAIRSIPTVMMFKNGEVVDQFMGVLPESQIKEKIDAYLDTEADALLQQARTAFGSADHTTALMLINQALASEPEQPRFRLSSADLLLEHNHASEAAQILDHLTIDLQLDPKVAPLMARLEFAKMADLAPSESELTQQLTDNPDNEVARQQLAAIKAGQGDYRAALELLLTSMKNDRSFNEGAARKLMIRIFEILGNQGDLVHHYRMQLARLLY